MADEANYNKFLRFFTSRLVQTLVQARLGSKIEQLCCGQPEQPDWFNMRLDELGEIAAYLRTALPDYPPVCKSVSIEFLLYTADGVYLPLETWVMSLDNEKQATVATEFYHQLGTLLRSASVAARVTPMHRYFVKKQSQDTFVILYRIFKGSMPADLGKGAKEVAIGFLPSPVGTVHLDLIYRTDMTLPQATSQELKSEPVEQPASINRRRSRYDDDLPCRPSFSDCVPVVGGQVETGPQSPACPSFTAGSPMRPSTPSPERKTRFRIGRSTSSEESSQSLHLSTSHENPICIFANSKPILNHSESFPFASLLLSSMPRRNSTFCNVVGTDYPLPTTAVQIQEATPISSGDSSHRTSKSPTKIEPENRSQFDSEGENEVEEEDEPMTQIFGGSTSGSLPSTLSEFIRDCRTAPSNLDGFYSESPDSLQSQLASFVSKEQDFAAFIKQVRESSIDDE